MFRHFSVSGALLLILGAAAQLSPSSAAWAGGPTWVDEPTTTVPPKISNVDPSGKSSSGGTPWDRQWVDHQGLRIRWDGFGDVGCASTDGQRCAPKSSQPEATRTVSCSDKRAHGGKTGYEQPGHWCNDALAVLTRDWKVLITGEGFEDSKVLSRTPLGDAMCFSVNGRDCGTPDEFRAMPPERRKQLSCGAVHQAVWGTTGYESPQHWCNDLGNRFLLAVTSDPQYPWPNEGGVPSSGNAEKDSEESIRNTYDSINRLHDRYYWMLRGTIVNGDVTAFGKSGEWDYMRTALARLKTPIYLGLGNHDIESNVDDCWENNCFLNSLKALRDYLPSDARMDVRTNKYYEHWSMIREQVGSFAWTKDIDGVQFIFLNNHANYTARTSNFVGSKAHTENVNLTSALPWLEEELRKARRAGKAIVLVSHKDTSNSADGSFSRQQFKDLVERYQVGAIFKGHVHDMAGGGPSAWGAHAEFISGSASTRTYLVASFDARNADGPVQMIVHLVRGGDIDHPEFLGRYALPTGSAEPPRVLPRQTREVRLVNNGGYVARFFVYYSDENGIRRTLSSGRTGLGDAWTAYIPAGADSAVQAKAEVLTGLVWDPWHTMLDRTIQESETCFKFWGTTLNPGWGAC